MEITNGNHQWKSATEITNGNHQRKSVTEIPTRYSMDREGLELKDISSLSSLNFGISLSPTGILEVQKTPDTGDRGLIVLLN